MKKLFVLAALSIAAILPSCSDDYDDTALRGRVDDLEDRVEQLETLCRQLNSDISSLHTLVTALQQNDYVTGVVPVVSGGETVGYTITFTKSDPITIYHGKDGENGHTPIIGVELVNDVYYWTLDGAPLTDSATGARIPASASDGMTPQLRIEEGYWQLSYDGSEWQQLGQATGDKGDTGAAGGDSIFSNVEDNNEEVVFTLADGVTTIVIPRRQTLAISFTEGDTLLFDINETQTIHYTITGGSDRNIIKAEMQNLDDCYTLRTTPTSTTKGTIAITATIPSMNNVIVSVSDGTQTIMAAIAVSIKPNLEKNTITVETPGTLAKLIADYDKTAITELTIIGNLNSSDISTLNSLPNLAVLDIENVNLEELPSRAFYDKRSLTDIKLPKTLKTIGAYAFNDCSSLTSITIPDSVTSIGKQTFCQCNSLTHAYITDLAKWCTIKFEDRFSSPICMTHNLYMNDKLIENLVIPEGVVSIGKHAFEDCNSLTSITIPEGVISIEAAAFCDCKKLTNAAISEGVTDIGTSAFLYCSSLQDIIIPKSVIEIGAGAFRNCSSLTNMTIPENVTKIGNSTFEGCSSLKSTTIPENVTELGQKVFTGCTGKCIINCNIPGTSVSSGVFYNSEFTEIAIGEHVISIGSYAFESCRKLTSITIPASVTEIGKGAFSGCYLERMYCKAPTPPALNDYINENIYQTTYSLYVPVGCKEAYAAADYWKNAKEIIETDFSKLN